MKRWTEQWVENPHTLIAAGNFAHHMQLAERRASKKVQKTMHLSFIYLGHTISKT